MDTKSRTNKTLFFEENLYLQKSTQKSQQKFINILFALRKYYTDFTERNPCIIETHIRMFFFENSITTYLYTYIV